ncbi:HAD family hydrolase [Anaerocolumna sedimenticola]|uniref:hypothetical protein n=1 Tax=Anaerocolumna sedimenticola TaxID=2696063 RepID=UPI00192A2B97|nr:hypothetical protein [Anaerocolumna sedimenticola]
MYKHIIWDFDGTLFDTYPVTGIAFQMTLKENGILESLDEIIFLRNIIYSIMRQ